MGEATSQPEIQRLQSLQPTKQDYKVAIVCGSIRKYSTNAGLARAIYEAKDARFFFHWV